MKQRNIWVLLLLLLTSLSCAASESSYPLAKAQLNFNDKASLQRGAQMFMNYCSGCHSLRYVRYETLAKGIGMTDSNGDIAKQILQKNLIFTDVKPNDPINTAMLASDAKVWFGVAPPDLSLIIKVRGADWVYTYLHSFYSDPAKQWGTNNLLFPDVAMPNVLLNLQGEQIPIYQQRAVRVDKTTENLPEVAYITEVKPGEMSTEQSDLAVNDLVNFLAYVAEPEQQVRERIGTSAIIFVIIFAVFAYLLKREYWKDVK